MFYNKNVFKYISCLTFILFIQISIILAATPSFDNISINPDPCITYDTINNFNKIMIDISVSLSNGRITNAIYSNFNYGTMTSNTSSSNWYATNYVTNYAANSYTLSIKIFGDNGTNNSTNVTIQIVSNGPPVAIPSINGIINNTSRVTTEFIVELKADNSTDTNSVSYPLTNSLMQPNVFWSNISVPIESAGIVFTNGKITNVNFTNSIYFTPDVPGEYIFELKVYDGLEYSTNNAVTIMTAVNPPPEFINISITPDPCITWPSITNYNKITLDISVSDINGNVTNATFSGFTNGTMSSNLTSSNWTVDIYAMTNEGSYTLSFTITDNLGMTNSTNISIQIISNTPPVAIPSVNDKTTNFNPLETDLTVELKADNSTDTNSVFFPLTNSGMQPNVFWTNLSVPSNSKYTNDPIFSTGNATNVNFTNTVYFTPDVPGEYIFELKVFDGLQWSTNNAITIMTANSPPVFNNVSISPEPCITWTNRTIYNKISLDSYESDDNKSVTNAFFSGFTNGTMSSNVTSSNWTADIYAMTNEGSYTLSILIIDNVGFTNSTNISIQIISNTPPIAIPSINGIINNTSRVTTELIAELKADNSTDTNSVFFPLTNSGMQPNVFWTNLSVPSNSKYTNDPIFSTGNATNVNFTNTVYFIPDVPGEYIFELKVFDGLQWGTNITIITAYNTPPIFDNISLSPDPCITWPDQTIYNKITLDILVSDNGIVTNAFFSGFTNGIMSSNNSTNWYAEIYAMTNTGIYTLSISLIDNGGITNSTNVTIQIISNSLPIAVPSINGKTNNFNPVITGSYVILKADESTDSNSTFFPLTNSDMQPNAFWSNISVPTNSKFKNSMIYSIFPKGNTIYAYLTDSAYFKPDVPGEYRFALKVFDGLEWSTNNTVTIITANSLPVFDNISITPNPCITLSTQNSNFNRITLDIFVSDDKGTVTNAFFSGFTNGTMSSNLTSSNWIADIYAMTNEGSYTLSISLIDDFGFINSTNIPIQIISNSPPVAVPSVNGQTSNYNPVTNKLIVKLNADQSTDADSVSYSLTNLAIVFWSNLSVPTSSALSNTIFPDGKTTNVNFTNTVYFTPDIPGEYKFILKVFDGLEWSITNIVTITATNTPPIFDNISISPNPCITLSTQNSNFNRITLDILVSDNGIVTNAFFSGFTNGTMSSNNSTNWTADIYAMTNEGSYTLSISLVDNEGLTNSTNVAIQIISNSPPLAVPSVNDQINNYNPLTNKLIVKLNADQSTDADSVSYSLTNLAIVFWSNLSVPTSSVLSNAIFPDGKTTNVNFTNTVYFTPDIPGEYKFILKVFDGLEWDTNVTMITAYNPPPVFDNINISPDPCITLSTQNSNFNRITLDILVSDDGSVTNAFFSGFANGTMSSNLTSSNWTAEIYATNYAVNNYTLSISLVDNDGITNSTNIPIQIISNSPPVAVPSVNGLTNNYNPVANKLIVKLNADQSTDADSVSYSLTNSAIVFWSNLSVPASSTLSNAIFPDGKTTNVNFTNTVYFTPDIPGEYKFTLKVFDGLEWGITNIVTINATNTPPVFDNINISPYPCITLSTQNSNFNRITLDILVSDNDRVTSVLFSGFTNGTMSSNLTSSNWIADIYAMTNEGSYTLSISLVDNYGVTNSTNVTIQIVSNTPPVAVPSVNGQISNYNPVTNKLIVKLNADQSTDTNSVSYSLTNSAIVFWSNLSVPASSTLSNAIFPDGKTTNVNFTNTVYFTPDIPGDYIFILKVFDGLEWSITNTVTITVDNPHPEFDNENFNISPNPCITWYTKNSNYNRITLDIRVSDNGSVTNATFSSFTNGTMTSNTTSSNWTAEIYVMTNAGNYPFVIEITDNEGNTHSTNITIQIVDNKRPVAIPSINGQTSNFNPVKTELIAELKADQSTDANSILHPLTSPVMQPNVFWRNLSVPSNSKFTNGSIFPTGNTIYTDFTNTVYFTPDIPGEYIFALEVFDGLQWSTNNTITIITATNPAPTFDNIISIHNPCIELYYITNFNKITLDISASDNGSVKSAAYSGFTTGTMKLTNSKWHTEFYVMTNVGIYTLLITLTDNFDVSHSSNYIIEIEPNYPPTIILSMESRYTNYTAVRANDAVGLNTGSSTDPNTAYPLNSPVLGRNVFWTNISVPPNSSLSNGQIFGNGKKYTNSFLNETIYFTPDVISKSNYEFMVIISDGITKSTQMFAIRAKLFLPPKNPESTWEKVYIFPMVQDRGGEIGFYKLSYDAIIEIYTISGIFVTRIDSQGYEEAFWQVPHNLAPGIYIVFFRNQYIKKPVIKKIFIR